MRLRDLLRETVATALSSRAASVLVCLVVAGTCFASIATVGRSAAAAADVAARLDDAGARTLRVVDANSKGFINRPTLDLINGLATVESAQALATPFDTVNGATGTGGPRIPTWVMVGDLEPGVEVIQGRSPEDGEAMVSVAAQHQLGLEAPLGYLTSVDGSEQFPIVGAYRAGRSLDTLNSGAVVNRVDTEAANALVVTIDDTTSATATVQAVLAIIDPPQSADVRIESPTALAQTARNLDADLAAQGRTLLLLILGIGGALVATVVLAQVMIRRRDLGRRRTLGASRTDLLSLVVGHCIVVGAVGAVLGSASGLWLNWFLGHPTPLQFGAGVSVLGMVTAALAALPPAFLATRLDPVTVMRVP